MMKTGAINWGNPVARCGLNDGLVSWWLARGPWIGGGTWFDLCGRHNGALTNMDPATDWIPNPRSGASHSLDFVGASSQSAAMGTIAATQNLTDATLCGWMRRPTAGTIAAFGTTGNTGSNRRIQVLWFSDNTVYSAVHDVFTTESLTSTEWQFFAVTLSGTAVVAYRNGVQVGTATSSTSGTSTVGDFNIGTSGASRFTTGQHDDVRFYNRALPAGDIQQLFSESLSGYPQTLNRISRHVGYVAAVPPGGFNPWWALRQEHYAGVSHAA